MFDLKLGGRAGYLLLKAFSKSPSLGRAAFPSEATGTAKLEADLGKGVWKYIKDQVVVDFGCGLGDEVVSAALHKAKSVYGLEIRDDLLAIAQRKAERSAVADRCFFLHSSRQVREVEALYGTVDTVLCLDAFEHFADPASVLEVMSKFLKPRGRLLVNFGPPWKHPYGAHARYITSIPWVHLIFSEETLLKLRSRYRNDRAMRFEDVLGGLNRMTVRRFLSLARNQAFEVEALRLRPVAGIRWLVGHPVIREFFTSAVECVLVKKFIKESAATGSNSAYPETHVSAY